MLSCSEQIVLLVLLVPLLLLLLKSLSSKMRLLADEVVLLSPPLAILMSSEASLIERMRLKKSHLESTSLSREMQTQAAANACFIYQPTIVQEIDLGLLFTVLSLK